MNAIKNITLVTLSAMITSANAVQLEADVGDCDSQCLEDYYAGLEHWFTAPRCAFRYYKDDKMGDWIQPQWYRKYSPIYYLSWNSDGNWCRWENFNTNTCKCGGGIGWKTDKSLKTKYGYPDLWEKLWFKTEEAWPGENTTACVNYICPVYKKVLQASRNPLGEEQHDTVKYPPGSRKNWEIGTIEQRESDMPWNKK